MVYTLIQNVIPEKNIVAFMPHYDDFVLGLGGYVLELKAQGLLATKSFHILLIFARSNYQEGEGKANFDASLERIKYATGKRLLEDMDCLDELLGEHTYRYELIGEKECFVRQKAFAQSEMEFPQGRYEDFDEEDHRILKRLQNLVRRWAMDEDTALIFPAAILEHIDHVITRQAGIQVAEELGDRLRARFYFQEDKPYAGIAIPEELERLETFVRAHNLQPRVYRHHPEQVVELVFKHYTSQVSEVYRRGVLQRSEQLGQAYDLSEPCDRLFAYPPSFGAENTHTRAEPS